MKLALWLILLSIALTPLINRAAAGSLTINIINQQQQPLADAVVELRSPATNIITPKNIKVAQQQLTFIPFVSAIPAGSQAEFPNLDKTRHHIYSFSPAKQFEIQLYADQPEAPIIFDTPGIVALGCNIHDYMQAYIYVGESELVAVSDEQGNVHWPDVPTGDYQLYLWHPWQLESPNPLELPVLDIDQTERLGLAIDLSQRKPIAPQRGFGSR
jgi:plastocyanin